ncbi:MAG: NADH dehydrogenase, partial [Firmicutes bacterium]|nr:NADH dehydrogenase [Bacillota bacterium]
MESLLLVLILLPIAGAFFAYKWEKTAPLFLLAELALVVVLSCFAPLTLDLSGILVSGLHLHLDGFQAVYALLASAAWFLSSLFSKEYGHHMHSRGRYYAFMLLTLAGTVGVFMSTHLMTTWICFEFMSFSPYVLVAQEEDEGALKAAGSYMTYGTIGGLAILMGLWMLHRQTGTLEIASLAAACESLSFAQLLPAGLCMLAGFGAKAGMFPLHTWLPAAHPVAPAPASALLSGVIVKTGIYGIAVVTVHMFSSSANHVLWGNLLLIFSVVTMVVGGLLALFSINLKRTLACSSMSQMGFVIFGLACTSLLGHHGSMAASGAVLHMVNHTLFKQVLFTLAGIVMLRTGSLLLNDVRGFGKGKPLLLIAYLCAALGIGGIPLLSGYVSKTLLHESLVHYMHSAHSIWYSAAEWLFLFSGGLTVAYMIKLFVVLFVDRPTTDAASATDSGSATNSGSTTDSGSATTKKPYMTRTTAFALLTPAVLLPV